MSNTAKYNQIFVESFSIEETKLVENPAYNEIESWDSIGHMNMIATLEDAFQITLETDDIIGFSSYQKGKEILGKYGVAFEQAN